MEKLYKVVIRATGKEIKGFVIRDSAINKARFLTRKGGEAFVMQGQGTIARVQDGRAYFQITCSACCGMGYVERWTGFGGYDRAPCGECDGVGIFDGEACE